MIARSFRRVAARLIPGPIRAKQPTLAALAAAGAVAALSGCGGKAAPAPQHVRGAGYRFAAPAGWTVRRSRLTAAAEDGSSLVQVSTFPLAKAYRPALFAAVAQELRVRMRQVAAQSGGRVESAGAVTAAGVRSHVYRVHVDGHVDEYTFVLVGRREYQLLCRSADADAAPCRQLQASFALAY
jgi:hypothetical protein